MLTALFQDDPGSGQGRIRCTRLANRDIAMTTSPPLVTRTRLTEWGKPFVQGVFGHLTGKRRDHKGLSPVKSATVALFGGSYARMALGRLESGRQSACRLLPGLLLTHPSYNNSEAAAMLAAVSSRFNIRFDF